MNVSSVSFLRNLVLVWFLIVLLMPSSCHALVGDLKFPQFPWNNKNGSGSSALQPGDTIAVIGASGNVGKLVALRLADTYKVHGVVRDASSVAKFLTPEDENSNQKKREITLYETNLIDEMMAKSTTTTAASSYPESLRAALQTANAVIICTGTTAFPTKAWTKSASGDDEDGRGGSEGVAKDVVQALVENSFSVQEALAALDAQGLNTPNNVDAQATAYLMQVWDAVCTVRQKRIIMLSSIGVQRRTSMPFPILNACGVLDAKAAGEAAIQQAATAQNYAYTIVRPGQLFGGPYDNNYYLGTLFQLDKDVTTQNIQVAPGDTLLGDTLRSTLAEITAQVCEQDTCRDVEFAVINTKGERPSTETVQQQLEAL